MNPLLKEIRHKPLIGQLAFVPLVFATQAIKPEAHTVLFVLSVLAITSRSSIRRRPPRGEGDSLGNNPSIFNHCTSISSGFAIEVPLSMAY